jgi:uncharacterized protein YkwD
MRGGPVAWLVLLTLGSGCATGPGTTAAFREAARDASDVRSFVVTPEDLAHCVAVTNRYRASVRLDPLERSAEAEGYAAASAHDDHVRGKPHHRSSGRNRPPGAFAENEALRWSFQQAGGSARTFIDRALAMMWAEGRGGGHYENIRGKWRVLGCGLYADKSRITLAQHFR